MPQETHYLALYRKYRPQTFEDVCGRDTIVRTIKNQINSGHIGHSYLFCGTRGTGKTTIAKIFAKAVNCEHPVDGNPCGECATCRAISDNADLNVVEMDAASNNSVDDIRGIIDQVAYSPTQGKYRVFIIDEVHMLSNAAFNALLKTLEEPPSYAIFILATTEPNKLPVTILSRCQRYDFGRMTVKTIEERLQIVCEREGLQVEEKALRYIAAAADGSMRDGLSILDQCNAFNYGNDVLTYDKTLEILGAVDTSVFSRLFRDIHGNQVRDALAALDEILSQGREIVQMATDFIGYLRNVMLLKASEEVADSLDVSSDNLQLMLEDARMSDLEEVIRYINVFSALTEQIRYSSNRRILTEAAVIRLCEPSMDISGDMETQFNSMKERIRVLEDKIAAGYVSAGPAPSMSAHATSEEEPSAPPVVPDHLPAAMTEDLIKVARDWNAMVGAIPSDHHFMKLSLIKAVPVAGEGGELEVQFDNFLRSGYFTEGDDAAEHRQYFANYLKSRIGKDLTIRYKLLDNGNQVVDNEHDIRNRIQGNINMQVDVISNETGEL